MNVPNEIQPVCSGLKGAGSILYGGFDQEVADDGMENGFPRLCLPHFLKILESSHIVLLLQPSRLTSSAPLLLYSLDFLCRRIPNLRCTSECTTGTNGLRRAFGGLSCRPQSFLLQLPHVWKCFQPATQRLLDGASGRLHL
jgi:hypothetical protein